VHGLDDVGHFGDDSTDALVEQRLRRFADLRHEDESGRKALPVRRLAFRTKDGQVGHVLGQFGRRLLGRQTQHVPANIITDTANIITTITVWSGDGLTCPCRRGCRGRARGPGPGRAVGARAAPTAGPAAWPAAVRRGRPRSTSGRCTCRRQRWRSGWRQTVSSFRRHGQGGGSPEQVDVLRLFDESGAAGVELAVVADQGKVVAQHRRERRVPGLGDAPVPRSAHHKVDKVRRQARQNRLPTAVDIVLQTTNSDQIEFCSWRTESNRNCSFRGQQRCQFYIYFPRGQSS